MQDRIDDTHEGRNDNQTNDQKQKEGSPERGEREKKRVKWGGKKGRRHFAGRKKGMGPREGKEREGGRSRDGEFNAPKSFPSL